MSDDAWLTFSISFCRCAKVALICVAHVIEVVVRGGDGNALADLTPTDLRQCGREQCRIFCCARRARKTAEPAASKIVDSSAQPNP